MREATTMASRRTCPPSPKSTGIATSSSSSSTVVSPDSTVETNSKTAAKNNVVVCLVFFSILANHARTITSQIFYSIRGMDKRELLVRILTFGFALAILMAIPLFVLQEIPSNFFWMHLIIVWNALLHVSIWPVTAFSCAVALRFVIQQNSSTTTSPVERRKSFAKSTLCVVLVTSALLIIHCQIQVIMPSWLWNPFLWGRYKLYLPAGLEKKLQGLCIQQDSSNTHPLCLTESSWSYLSAGALSSTNPNHVQAVRQGLERAQREDGGLVLNVMARDVIDSIGPLQLNVEALLPFFRHLAVVVFENDSVDGSREAFQEWAARAKGYTVDVLDCGPDNMDCKFGLSHRYDATEAKDYFTSSAIGKMAVYRQKLVDYIVESPKYQTNYSHMMVIDLDLKVSLSPLGILHTLGTVPDVAVASSGRQVWPGSLGSMTPPYDFSAFRTLVTEKNQHLVNIHHAFCGLLPSGDRWRNQCDAASSIHLLLVLLHDWLLTEEAYPTESAFNGATLYPLDLIRSTNAKYDDGDDGQRCEHIGFNIALGKPTYINPKWNFHVMPTNPGGPTGVRSLKNVIRIVFMPRLSMVIFFQLEAFLVIYVVCIMYMTCAVVEPIVAATRGKFKEQETELPLFEKKKEVVDDFSLAKRHLSGANKRTSC